MKYHLSLCLFAFSAIVGAQQPVTLQQAVQSARTQRPAFEAAHLRVAEAKLSRRALGAFPATRLSVGYTSDPEVGGSDDDLVLSQPLDIFGRTAAAGDYGNALVALAEAEFRRVAAEVQNDVAIAFVDAATSVELAKSAIAVQETLEKLYEATRLRVEGGAAAGVQLTRVGLELDQAKLRTMQHQTGLSANLRRLTTLIGSTKLTAVPAGFPEFPAMFLDEASLVRQRPDLSLLAAEVRAAEANARIARLSGKPELELQGRRTPWQESEQRYGLRLQLSIPLFDHGLARAETRAANARADATRQALADATKIAVGEVGAATIEVEAGQDQVTRYEALVTTARQLVERLRPALTDQATTLFEVIDATRSMREVEEGLIGAKQRLAEAQVRLLRASGHILEVGQ